MEEVATMEIYTMTRPSMLLTAACAPSAPKLATAAAPWAAPVLAATRAPISRVHQVPSQAELALESGRTNGINGTTGFMGLGASVDSKAYVDERGGPPRGRPV